MKRKRVTHIPDNAFIGYTYCGRHWLAFDDSERLDIIDLKTDDIESATCRACQRSDDRRVREEEEGERAASGDRDREAGAQACRARTRDPQVERPDREDARRGLRDGGDAHGVAPEAAGRAGVEAVSAQETREFPSFSEGHAERVYRIATTDAFGKSISTTVQGWELVVEMLEILRAEGHHCKLATETWVR